LTLAVACAAFPAAAFHAAAAQSTTSLQTDATVLPRRSFSIGLLSSWTRFDELLGNGGQRNLASSFNVDSLTGAQIPGLPTNSLIQAATGTSNLRVTAGNITSAANARIVTSPLIVQYGLTSRLTLGVVVPLVQTRTTFIAGLNQHGIGGNVGVNPALLSGSWSQNAGVVSGLHAAAQALATTLSTCPSNPTAPACQNQAAANALNSTATQFASTLAALYGTGQNNPGTTFVPIAGSNIQAVIQNRLDSISKAYQFYNTPFAGGTLQAATAPANAVLNAVLVASGYDTLQSPDRSSIGDVSIGATYQLANSYPDSVPGGGFHRRLSINATGRIGTGEPANRSRLFDNPTGYGQPGLILGGAADVAWGTRFGLSALGSYTMQFGSVDVSRLPNTAYAALPLTAALGGTYSAGNVLALTAIPRIRLGEHRPRDSGPHPASSRSGAPCRLPATRGAGDRRGQTHRG
jgi:hypothetical protein